MLQSACTKMRRLMLDLHKLSWQALDCRVTSAQPRRKSPGHLHGSYPFSHMLKRAVAVQRQRSPQDQLSLWRRTAATVYLVFLLVYLSRPRSGPQLRSHCLCRFTCMSSCYAKGPDPTGPYGIAVAPRSVETAGTWPRFEMPCFNTLHIVLMRTTEHIPQLHGPILQPRAVRCGACAPAYRLPPTVLCT